MFGREVRLPVEVMFGGPPDRGKEHSGYVAYLRDRLETGYELVRKQTKATQKRQKDYYDRRTAGSQYQVGDRV